jgi:outer membrane protein assembly factor BamB
LRKPTLLLILAVSSLFTLPAPLNPTDQRSQILFPNVGPSGSTDYPWTMFHYDSARDGVTQASGPPSAPTSPMWTYTTGNTVYPSPVVADGYVFIPSYDGTIYALDEYTGNLLWSFFTGGNIIGTPAVANSIVYVSSKNGYVYALDEQTGSVVWRIANDNLTPVTSSPVIADGKLFWGTFLSPSSGYAEVLAVNPQTGSVIWRNTGISDYVEGSLAVRNGRVFLGIGALNNAQVLSLNESTGAQIWAYNTGLAVTITGSPAVAYGRVYVPLDGTRFLALDEYTGFLDWSFATASNSTTAAAYNGILYFGAGNRNVYAVNASTGASIWTRTTGGAVTSSPALSLGSNELFVGSNDRYLYALNMMTGAVNWRFLTGGQVSSSPAVANNRVFFGAKDHKVYALGAALPKLFDTVNSNPTTLLVGQTSLLTITVSNSSSPKTGATLTITSSQGGTFTTPVDLGTGTYQANYTAPSVNTPTLVTIRVTASINGYLSATNQTSITVNPLPILTVEVSPRPSSITPGGEITLMVKVANGTILVAGATLSLSSSSGGSFSSITDSGNGNYTAVFSTPLQNSNPIVTVRASKPGFTDGQGQTTVSVNGVPDLTTLKVAGTSFFLLLAAGAVLFLLILAAFVRRNKTSHPQVPPKPDFTY